MRRDWLLAIVAFALGLALTAGAQERAAARTLFVFYEQRDKAGGADADVDIYLQRLTEAGRTGWEGHPGSLPVATAKDFETAPAACEDGAGGAIVAYEYRFASGQDAGDKDIVAQRVDASGKALWNNGDSPVPVASSKGTERHPLVVSDGRGGAIVVYEWLGEKKDVDLMAQRVDGQGRLLWGEGQRSVAVATSPANERRAVAVPDGQGGVIVVFEWEGENGDMDVMAQHISASGEVLWNEGKRATDIAATDNPERRPAAISDGAGGVIVAFEFEYAAGEHKGDVDIMAQHLSGDGKLLWSRAKDVCTAKGLERRPVAVSDGMGGVIVACEYEPTQGENAGDTDVMAQRLNSQGEMMWNQGDRSAIVSSGKFQERIPRALATSDGGAIFVFEVEARTGEEAGNVDVMAQRLSATGAMMWNQGDRSATVCTSRWQETGPIVLPDGADGAIAVLTMVGPKGEFEGDEDVDATRLAADGTLSWHEGKKPVDIAAGEALERNPCAVIVAN